MISNPKKISVLGSTGSIGQKTLDIVSSNPQNFIVEVLMANSNVDLLARQALEFDVPLVAICDESKYLALKEMLRGSATKILAGCEGCCIAAETPVDLVVSAISGIAGLMPTLSALKNTLNLAIANKESLVCAGKFIKSTPGLNIIPIDSEQHAIFQIYTQEVSKITLTASGGPFFKHRPSHITREAALKHPIWKMGLKNSVDSATLVNKVLEVFETEVLFAVDKKNIQVLIHPESILHGMVSYRDGNNIAVLYEPDMGIPISNALFWPDRQKYNNHLGLEKIGSLTFHAPSTQQYPALELLNSDCCLLINSANEVAVELFLEGKINFDSIVPLIAETITKYEHSVPSSIEEVLAIDREVKETALILSERFCFSAQNNKQAAAC